MVRGATLELLDITYDGLEDPITGYLTGGLGQLVDGKYGAENYRAVGENGLVRGQYQGDIWGNWNKYVRLKGYFWSFVKYMSLKSTSR